MNARYPVRLVLCVDGTWGDPDGTVRTRRQGNISNIYRIYSAVQKGMVEGRDGKIWYQKKRYLRGIMDLNGIIPHLWAGIFGTPLPEQIKEIYRLCCEFATEPEDEIFLFGYSRGAFAVRAVANIIHFMGMPRFSANLADFDNFYAELLRQYPKVRAREAADQGSIDSFLSTTRPQNTIPRIRFVGVFDTVKAFNDNNLYDIVPVFKVKNYRQALALNEYNTFFTPEVFYSRQSFATNWVGEEWSLLQAWFVGSHSDLGGATQNDGLSLYPLQWMLLEARNVGLGLGGMPIAYQNAEGNTRQLDDTESIICPYQDPLDSTFRGPYTYSTMNRIKVEMWDLRRLHNLRESLAIKLHDAGWPGLPVVARNIFKDSSLRGYFSDAPVGTFIHPSAYLICHLDLEVFEKSEKWPFLKDFQKAKGDVILNDEEVYWFHPTDDPSMRFDQIRILVCGNAGVGKTRLINTVFGVEVTPPQHHDYGKHDVNHGHQFDGAVVHDSCGFAEGSDVELELLKKFLKDVSKKPRLPERLHTIWYCLNPAKRERAQINHADRRFFELVRQYDDHVPIIIILAKSDEMLEHEKQLYLTEYKRLFDGILPSFSGPILVSNKNDPNSIDNLVQLTMASLDDARVRSLLVSAQICHVECKSDLALEEAIKWINILQARPWSSRAVATNMWLAEDPRQSVGRDLCRLVFEKFGYSQTDTENATSLMWKSFTREHITSAVGASRNIGSPGLFILQLLGTGALATVFLTPLISIPFGGFAALCAAMVPTLTQLDDFKQILLIALIDIILIADRIFWINPEVMTADGFVGGYEQYLLIAHKVHDEIKEILSGMRREDIFDFEKVETPLKHIIHENRARNSPSVNLPVRSVMKR